MEMTCSPPQVFAHPTGYQQLVLPLLLFSYKLTHTYETHISVKTGAINFSNIFYVIQYIQDIVHMQPIFLNVEIFPILFFILCLQHLTCIL